MLQQRLEHVSMDIIHSLIHTSSITGLHVINNFPPFICDSCKYAKTTWKPICKECTAAQAQTFGEEAHTDVWGPSPTLSLGSRKYYVTFTDDSTQYTQLQVLWTNVMNQLFFLFYYTFRTPSQLGRYPGWSGLPQLWIQLWSHNSSMTHSDSLLAPKAQPYDGIREGRGSCSSGGVALEHCLHLMPEHGLCIHIQSPL